MHEPVGDDGHLTAIAKQWQQGLVDITLLEAKAAMEECLRRDEVWPPSLQEFRLLCKPTPKPPAHRLYKALPAYRSNKDTAEGHIKKILADLARGRQAHIARSEEIAKAAATKAHENPRFETLWDAYKHQFVLVSSGERSLEDIIANWAEFQEARSGNFRRDQGLVTGREAAWEARRGNLGRDQGLVEGQTEAA